jgi:hypothetical protein
VLETLDRVAVAHSAMVSQVTLAWSRAQSSIPCAIAAPPRSSSCTNCEAGAGFRFVKMNYRRSRARAPGSKSAPVPLENRDQETGGHEGRPYPVHREVQFYTCSTSGEAVLAPSLVLPVVGWLWEAP